jgi:hypothetical protein
MSFSDHRRQKNAAAGGSGRRALNAVGSGWPGVWGAGGYRGLGSTRARARNGPTPALAHTFTSCAGRPDPTLIRVGSPDTWERQATETSKAFAAFVAYRGAGPDRSLRKTAAELGKHPTQLERWSRRHRWQVRIHAYETMVDRKRQADAEREREAMVARHTRQAMLLASTALDALAAVEGHMLTTSDVARWLEVAQKLERAARGERKERDAARQQYLALWEKLGGDEQLPA